MKVLGCSYEFVAYVGTYLKVNIIKFKWLEVELVLESNPCHTLCSSGQLLSSATSGMKVAGGVGEHTIPSKKLLTFDSDHERKNQFS